MTRFSLSVFEGSLTDDQWMIFVPLLSLTKFPILIGSIPLRQLVYRVHPLPESMRPLVWDFGQLTDHAEELYTMQIVKRFFDSIPPIVSSNCVFSFVFPITRGAITKASSTRAIFM